MNRPPCACPRRHPQASKKAAVQAAPCACTTLPTSLHQLRVHRQHAGHVVRVVDYLAVDAPETLHGGTVRGHWRALQWPPGHACNTCLQLPTQPRLPLPKRHRCGRTGGAEDSLAEWSNLCNAASVERIPHLQTDMVGFAGCFSGMAGSRVAARDAAAGHRYRRAQRQPKGSC